ncbi:MAG TPA: hypothetical protein VNG33_07845 [Polyangiaceae bacterium]|nr:hypothetical protein [Polyangiaceae bacterium]
MRRVCDLCAGAGAMFVACSLSCLERHLAEQHGEDACARESSETRARICLAELNRRLAGSRQRYHEHRQQVMALALETTGPAAGPAGDIAIFGAGNGSDLDLPRLADSFREIHLVDLDAEALERARQELPTGLRARVIPHAPVELSGFMSRLDEWGDSFPDDATLGRAAFAAARAIVAALGRDFDVVLSTGALSQLIVPFHRAWLASSASWERLDAAIVAVHLATLVLSTRAGGRGVMAFDVPSSKDPRPTALLGQLQLPGMASLVQEPRLTSPWSWDLGGAVQLVYGLTFRRSTNG